jgi:hypothetical protein
MFFWRLCFFPPSGACFSLSCCLLLMQRETGKKAAWGWASGMGDEVAFIIGRAIN